jgi:hypothetical protein
MVNEKFKYEAPKGYQKKKKVVFHGSSNTYQWPVDFGAKWEAIFFQ